MTEKNGHYFQFANLLLHGDLHPAAMFILVEHVNLAENDLMSSPHPRSKKEVNPRDFQREQVLVTLRGGMQRARFQGF